MTDFSFIDSLKDLMPDAGTLTTIKGMVMAAPDVAEKGLTSGFMEKLVLALLTTAFVGAGGIVIIVPMLQNSDMEQTAAIKELTEVVQQIQIDAVEDRFIGTDFRRFEDNVLLPLTDQVNRNTLNIENHENRISTQEQRTENHSRRIRELEDYE